MNEFATFKFDFTDKERLKVSFETLVKFTDFVSNLVPNETVKKAAAYFKEVVSTDWFLELVVWVAKLFEKQNVSPTPLAVS